MKAETIDFPVRRGKSKQRQKIMGLSLTTLYTLLVLGFLFYVPQSLCCRETGFQYYKNYSPREYDWGYQNWWILEDKRGIIYVGNNNGLLEFDGVSWRKISIPNNAVRSLARDDTGTIYIGGYNEIGFLAPDSRGTLQYVSLLDQLDKDKRKFGNVLGTFFTKDGVYFRTVNYMFRWYSGQLKVIAEEKDWKHGFLASFICAGKLYIRKGKKGLMQVKGSSLKLLPGGETFAEKKIFMMAPQENQNLLIGTWNSGFFTYDGTTAVPIETEADDYLKENRLYHGIPLNSGGFALATRRGGLVIIDSRRRLMQIYTRTRGLPDNNVRHVYEDSQLNLWLALDKGITKIEYASPISIYDNRSDLFGIVLAVVRHGPHNDLYAGTTEGFFQRTSNDKFRRIPIEIGSCWFLLSTGDSLLAAATGGVFQVENDSWRQVIKTRSYVLYHSHKDKNRIWVGTIQGLVSMYFQSKNSQWTEEFKYENIKQEIITIAEDNNGNLWLGTRAEGVLKVDFSTPGTIINPKITDYHASHNLPAGEVHVFMAIDHVMFASPENGIFRFDEKNNLFIPDPTLGDELANGSRGVFRIVEDNNRHIWLHSQFRNLEAIPQDGAYTLNEKPFLRIPTVQVNAIYPDPVEDNVWFASDDGLIRFDTRVKKDCSHDFNTLVRKIWVNKELVFDGYKKDDDPGALCPVFPVEKRNFRFQFAAPFFEDESAARYRWFLEGYDDDWSDLSSEPQKEYTNLDSGLYIFRVRAINVYRHEGREAVFQFRIIAPWYKTWWAFFLYAIISLLLVFLIVKWRSGKLQREKVRLERIVKERTGEIEEKNQQLEDQTLQLQEQSEKLKEMDKVKSRFFANISHEFRTPLTLIMGPLEQMLADTRAPEQGKKIGLMLRSSQRLLTLINQLLELSRFESGKIKLQAARQNIIPFIKGIAASFEPVCTRNQLDLKFRTEEEHITLYFDPEKLEDVFLNLLANAVKFTPPGGEITVTASKSQAGETAFPSGSMIVSICDTGPGIPREQLEHIFDRFYQSDSTYEHHRKGSGIGLTIAKELVELHRGRIDVHSHEGKGTEFIIRLPMGKEHLEPDEIVELSETDLERSGHIGDDKIGMMEIPGAEAGEATAGQGIEPESLEKNIILVVEDSADTRDYIKSSLEAEYRVVEAKDGKEGIQKAQEIIPDLIVSDIMMPGADGYELCRVLKNDVRTSHVPVVLLTARAEEQDILRGLETGADDYITKPFNTKMLGARIKNLIDLRSHLQQTQKRSMALQPVKIPVSTIDEEFLKRLQKVIEENISDPDFNVEEFCRKMDMSQPTLYRKMYALTGESPTDYIRSYRLKRGAQLLKENFGTVLEVAFEVGFSSANYFTRCFKKKFHQLPSTFQAAESGLAAGE